MRARGAFRPLQPRGRRAIAAILIVFALFSVLTVALSTRASSHSQNQATVVNVAARQRTLAERYVNEVLLVRSGHVADPAHTAQLLAESATVLLDGGVAPEVEGDDDETTVSGATDPGVRAQLEQARKLVADLTATGGALLDGPTHRRGAS